MKSFLRGLLFLMWTSATLLSQELFFPIVLDSTATGGNSPGRGTGFAILSNDKKSLRYDITVNKLNGNITAAHFHYLYSTESSANTTVHTVQFVGKTASSTWSNIADSIARAFFEGRVYVNVHTSSAPGGEIRGTIEPRQIGFPLIIDGTSAGTSSQGRGTGYVLFETGNDADSVDKISYRATYAGLQGNITAAHFHSANGGGVFRPVTFVDSTVSETWQNFPDSALSLFLRRKAYLNIHTSVAAGGEVRATNSFVGEIPFIGALDGAQAGTASTAKGTTWAVLRPDLSLQYNATYAKLQGTFSAAHFHSSDGGGVIRPVTFTGNQTTGTWTGLSDKNLQDLLKGRVYLNVHSSTNAGGEIRATMKFIDGAFTANVDGAQASTSSTAKGTAWMYIIQDSLLYHATIAGLNGTFSAAHFHNAFKSNGVVHPLTFTDSTTSGYWNAQENTFDLVFGGIYINIHSSIAAGGEIRGNFALGTGIPTSVKEISGNVPMRYSLDQNFPNPFNPTTTIRFSVPVSGLTTVKVFDILGKEIATLVNGEQKSGQYEVQFNASSLSTGLYFYQLKSGSFVQTKKMMLVK